MSNETIMPTCFIYNTLGRDSVLTELLFIIMFKTSSFHMLINMNKLSWSHKLDTVSIQTFSTDNTSSKIESLTLQNESADKEKICRNYTRNWKDLNFTILICLLNRTLHNASLRYLDEFYCELNEQNGAKLLDLSSSGKSFANCRNNPDSECWDGACCDMDTCQYKSVTAVCRDSVGECDIPEYCPGLSSSCPEDQFFSDGTVCDKNGYKGYCYQRQCRTKASICRAIHPMMRGALKECKNRLLDSSEGECESTVCWKPFNLKYILSEESTKHYSKRLGQCFYFSNIPNGMPCAITPITSDRGLCINRQCTNISHVHQCNCDSSQFECSNLGSCLSKAAQPNSYFSWPLNGKILWIFGFAHVCLLFVVIIMVNLKNFILFNKLNEKGCQSSKDCHENIL